MKYLFLILITAILFGCEGSVDVSVKDKNETGSAHNAKDESETAFFDCVELDWKRGSDIEAPYVGIGATVRLLDVKNGVIFVGASRDDKSMVYVPGIEISGDSLKLKQ